ncbi:MAG: 16S rRNA (cytosine(1402)-N(4))-methyltransferase RsmH [Candidatus Promineifilaceae bacterium]|jgi:16S rRNA (cytosine1402-N4)-methyltransferase
MDQMKHIPVLYNEVLELLQPRPGGQYIDGTLGGGGHTKGLLEASAPDGRVLVFDRDAEAIEYAQKRLLTYGERVVFVNASYSTMSEMAAENGFTSVEGVLLDLGLSSRQLADAKRGFAFSLEGPLDMRFDTSTENTAAELINTSNEAELVEIFRRYGEVKQSSRIARLIVANRPFHSTTELAEIIAQDVRRGRIHPATQVFQALRIAVNNELAELERGIEAAVNVLEPGGRLAVIAFHSLEDRIVKNRFRELSKECVCPPEQPICTCDAQPTVKRITHRVVKATDEEVIQNPRSRSARLRVVEKL